MARGWQGLAAGFFALVACGSAADAQSGGLFQRLSGSWSGAGTVVVSGGAPERIRCRADFRPNGSAQLQLGLRCASDAFNLDVSSSIVREGNRISGSWSEASFGASGEVSGGVSADSLRADVSGAGTTARLTMSVRGNSQSVNLVSEGAISSNASITLQRN